MESMGSILDPSYVNEWIDSRSISPENPTGARGAGGPAGRKGNTCHLIRPGSMVVLADIAGPGTVRHFYAWLRWTRPASMRALRLEIFYDGLEQPSVSVPITDFFGLPHGRPVEFFSQLMSAPEARGLNSYIPMPFTRSIRIEIANESDEDALIEHQIDYTLEPLVAEDTAYLHATFRRENPTALRHDFVLTDGLRGPGRFLGCVVGIRILDTSAFYGEGEMKIFRDGDRDLPTICGTSLEAYLGSGAGLGRHHGAYAGVPLYLSAPEADHDPLTCPDFLSFYRWHLLDPVMFATDLRVTLQQIGTIPEFENEDDSARFQETRVPTGTGWWHSPNDGRLIGTFERQDDVCATVFVYCRNPQPVPRLDLAVATSDLDRLPYEHLTPTEFGRAQSSK
jgi:hypothetical protein